MAEGMFDLDAERAVLGSCLIETPAVDLVTDKLAGGHAFYRSAHSEIWRCMEALRGRGEPIDLVTLSTELGTVRGRLEAVGGIAYLTSLAAMVPTAAHAERYADIVRGFWLRRRIRRVSSEIAAASEDLTKDIDTVEDDAVRALLELSQEADTAGLVDGTDAELDAIMVALGLQKPDPGLATGYSALDGATGGLPKPGLVIVAGRPGLGKTAFALNIAHRVAFAGGNAGIFSLEMSRNKLAERRLALEARVDSMRIRMGTLTRDEQERVADAGKRLQEHPLLLDDSGWVSAAQIRARVRRAHAQKPLDLVIVDYIQLVNEPKDRNETRAQVIGRVSKSLLALSKDLCIPVIALSQLNRASELRADKRPTMADLRESGELEQDAELILLLHRRADAPTVLEVDVAKNRNGAADMTLRFAWKKEHQRVDTLEPFAAPPASAREAKEDDEGEPIPWPDAGGGTGV